MKCVTRFAGLLAALAVIVVTPSLAAEPKALATCIGCHGKDGVGISADYANLGGQNRAYLVLQLQGFRSGERKNVLMNGMAAGLSDTDIDELAAWYAGQAWVVADNGNANLVEEGLNRAGYCHACHGMKGYPVTEDWPILAGQSAPYLDNQLRAFKSGTRYHPLMVNVVKDLQPSAMTALASYYTQLNGLD
jgi:cytochrome c553